MAAKRIDAQNAFQVFPFASSSPSSSFSLSDLIDDRNFNHLMVFFSACIRFECNQLIRQGFLQGYSNSLKNSAYLAHKHQTIFLQKVVANAEARRLIPTREQNIWHHAVPCLLSPGSGSTTRDA